MNFEDETYVRLYTRNTITTKRLGFEGRAVLWHLMREADRAGVIEVGEGDLVEALTVLLADVPEDAIRAAVPRLESQGVTQRHGSKLLLVRFIEAQEAKRSDAARAKEYRERRRAGIVTRRDEASHGVTERHETTPNVTERHETSLSALPCSALPPLGEAPPPPAPEVYRTDGAGTRLVDAFGNSFAPVGDVERYAFDAWAKAFGKGGATFDSKRAACLSERVATGMTKQDADDAIAGALADEWVTGKKTGKRNDRLTAIFSDAERYEEFRDRGRARSKPRPLRSVAAAEREAAYQERLRAEAAARQAELAAEAEACGLDVSTPPNLAAILGGIGG